MPVAVTLSVVLCPLEIVVDAGCEVIAGAVQVPPHVPPGYTDSAAWTSHGCSDCRFALTEEFMIACEVHSCVDELHPPPVA